MAFQTLHVFGKDYPDELPWDLLSWCRERGATEFNVDGILTDGGSEQAFEAFDDLADQHRLPSGTRYDVHAGAPQSTKLWVLNDTTLRALRVAFPHGYFEYVPADAWFENLSAYRSDGALMLGVITHESEGVLRVSELEREDLDRRGFIYRSEGKWVGVNEAAV